MVKVYFKAKIKNELPQELMDKLRQEAQKIPGFISIDSKVVDGIDHTVSVWRDLESVDEWRNHSIHRAAKDKKDHYYEWVESQIVEE